MNQNNYSLYGWRAGPPLFYPQNTFNTPYDITMRNCTIWCPYSGHRECQSNCRKKALISQGINRNFPRATGEIDPITRKLIPRRR